MAYGLWLMAYGLFIRVAWFGLAWLGDSSFVLFFCSHSCGIISPYNASMMFFPFMATSTNCDCYECLRYLVV